MPLIAANRALTRLGLPRDRIAMRDYTSLFGLLAQKQINPAAELLRDYLKMMAEKSVARLKIVAIVSEVQHHRAVPHANPPELIGFPSGRRGVAAGSEPRLRPAHAVN